MKSALMSTGQTSFEGHEVSPIAANQNNYKVDSDDVVTDSELIAITANVDITGLAGGYPGRLLTLLNSPDSTFTVTLKNYNASSLEPNKFLFGTTATAQDYILTPGKSVILRYINGYWRDYPSRFIYKTKAPSIADAADISPAADATLVHITGTGVNIDRISTGGRLLGSVLILHFDTGGFFVNHQGAATGGGFARINLRNGVDMNIQANERLELYLDGPDWWEISRTQP